MTVSSNNLARSGGYDETEAIEDTSFLLNTDGIDFSGCEHKY